MKLIDFNVNDYVRVRLTSAGLSALRKRHDDLMSEFPRSDFKWKEPAQDAEGWSRWQLWSLMQELGPAIHMGGATPFETTIKIEDTS